MSWDPTVARSAWGRLQVIIDGEDVTFFRDVPTEVRSWSSGDPFDDATAVIVFPQVSPFEKAGVGTLSWLKGHALVDIRLVRPNGTRKTLWEGMIASIEDLVDSSSASVTVECIGALYQLDYHVRSPKNLTEERARLYEHAIREEFSGSDPERRSLKTSALRIQYPDGMNDTQWRTRYSGSWEPALTGYVQRLLADMVHSPGFIRDPGEPAIPAIPGTNEIQAISLEAEPPPWPWGSSYPSTGPDNLQGLFWLTFRGQRTVGINWDGNATDVRNALLGLSAIDDVSVSGSGVRGDPWRVEFVGSKVRQKPQPKIELDHHSLRHDHSGTWVRRVQAGETGIEGKDAVDPSDPEPWEGAWTLLKNNGRRPVLKLRDESTVTWTISAGAPGVEHDLKADHSQTPNIFYGEGTDESGTTWRNTVVTVDSKGESRTRHWPLSWNETVHPANKSTSEAGEPTSPVPRAYNEDTVRVETMQKYGTGVSLLDARRSADQQLLRERDPGWFGTVTLKSDPEEGSRYEVKAGTNIRLKHFRKLDPPPKEIYAELESMGVVDTEFGGMPLLRGEFCSWTVAMATELGISVPAGTTNQYPDVPNSHEDSDAINALSDLGITEGFADGFFRPDDPMRRDDMAQVIVEFVQWDDGALTARRDHFPDDSGSPHHQLINRGAENDLVKGRTTEAFFPAEHAIRREGGEFLYLLNRFYDGGMLEGLTGAFLHVAEVDVDFAAGTVSLTVDTKSRDLATLAQLIERVKSENKNPAKMLMVNRESSSTDDTKFPWDYDAGSGSIPKRARAPRAGTLPRSRPDVNPEFFVKVNGTSGDPFKRWTIVPVVAASKGSVSKSEIRAFDNVGQPLAIPFHVGVYQLYITEYSMPKFPFAEGAFSQEPEDALSGFDPSAAILWGQAGQRAGYWPGLESEGGSPTGVMIDDGTWQFQLPEGESVLWVAIYAESTAWFQGRFFHGVQS